MNLSNSAINKIGDTIRKGPEEEGYISAVETLNIWREWHGSILDEYYNKCCHLSAKHSREIIIARRLKRLPTIIDKLDRQPSMRLSSMQDIAGVRIVVKNMAELKLLQKRISRWNYLKNTKNYILNTKPDGYRGIHLLRKRPRWMDIRIWI